MQVDSEQPKFMVLVAEDEEFQRHNLVSCLQFCQFDTFAVEDGKQAVIALKDPGKKFDLNITVKSSGVTNP